MSKQSLWLCALALMTVLACIIACAIGTTSVGFDALLQLDPIVTDIRLPRVLLGVIAGAGLAVSGAVLQAVLRNPLADPYIAGVSGGAALGGTVAIAFGAQAAFVPVWAFAGAISSVLALLLLLRIVGQSNALTLLLAGVMFNAFASAVVTLLKVLATSTKAQEILLWLLGYIGVYDYATLSWAGLSVLGGCLLLLFSGGALNLLALGDDHAQALGLHVRSARVLVFVVVSLVVAAIVSLCGLIGFVGLLIPHVLRPLVGANHRLLLPASAFAGATFLVLSDALGRAGFFVLATEVPVGAITAVLGVPCFWFVLWRQRPRGL